MEKAEALPRLRSFWTFYLLPFNRHCSSVISVLAVAIGVIMMLFGGRSVLAGRLVRPDSVTGSRRCL